MGVTEPARRPRKHLAAWSLTIVTLAVLTAALVFTALNTSRIGTARVGLSAVLAAGVLMYAASGHLIASRRPDNAIGWLLGSIGLSLAVSMFAEQYAVYGLATAPGAVPVPKAVGGAAGTAAAATVVLWFYIVLLFPDGHLPSPRWRPVLWAMIVVFTGWGTQQFQAGTKIRQPRRVRQRRVAARAPHRRLPGLDGRPAGRLRPAVRRPLLPAGLTADSTQGWISGSPLPGRCRGARRSVEPSAHRLKRLARQEPAAAYGEIRERR